MKKLTLISLIFVLGCSSTSKEDSEVIQKEPEATEAPMNVHIETRSECYTNGKNMFFKNCISCHDKNLRSDGIGPNLRDVHLRRSEEWIREFVKDPVKMIKDGDPYAKALQEKYNGSIMVPFGQVMLDEEIDCIMEYIEVESEMTK